MKEKKTKKAPAPKKEGYSRIQSFCDAVKSKGKGQVKDLITIANKKYVFKGGKDNLKESAWACKHGVQVLRGMGILNLDGDSYKLN